jgi:hypothetical protein
MGEYRGLTTLNAIIGMLIGMIPLNNNSANVVLLAVFALGFAAYYAVMSYRRSKEIGDPTWFAVINGVCAWVPFLWLITGIRLCLRRPVIDGEKP